MTRYLGRRTAWERILDPDGEKPTPHLHSCPECHEEHSCTMDCTLHPVLERADGVPRGNPTPCLKCARPHTKIPGGRIHKDTSGTATANRTQVVQYYVYAGSGAANQEPFTVTYWGS